MALANGPIQAPGTLCYLKYNKKFKQEKPFFIRFPVDDYPGAKQTNLEFDFYNVNIQDMRGRESTFKFDTQGFQLMEFHSQYDYQDFDNFHKIAGLYNSEIEIFLKEEMKFAFVEVYDILVSQSFGQVLTSEPFCLNVRTHIKLQDPSTHC